MKRRMPLQKVDDRNEFLDFFFPLLVVKMRWPELSSRRRVVFHLANYNFHELCFFSL
ncbi:hypothetical protein DsansV1_C26g0192501 [Dioscorea sansibarensis]